MTPNTYQGGINELQVVIDDTQQVIARFAATGMDDALSYYFPGPYN